MIGRLVTRFPRWILAVTGTLFVLCAVVAASTIDSLALNRYEAPGSESMAAREALDERFGTGTPNVAILVSAAAGDLDTGPAAAVGHDLTSTLSAYPGVGDAWSYWSPHAPDSLASEDGRHGLILAWVPGDADRVRSEILPAIEEELIATIQVEGVSVQLGGGDEIFRVVAEQARADFLRAELIILPLVALLLWLVYRRLMPALITLGVGLFAVVGSLAIIRLVTGFAEISTFASNVSLVMGIGLGVDYGLFIISRFRQELTSGIPVANAVRRTVASAGRTVLFSGATVAAALAVLFVFPFPFLTSFAYAGIAVVLAAVLGAGVALPAALQLLGHRLARKHPVPAAEERGFWFRTATAVMKRPIAAGGAGLIVLLALGAPTLGLNFGSPDDRVLNADHGVRAMYDTIRADFAAEDADAILVVAPNDDGGAADAIGSYAADLSSIDGVERVDSAVGAYTDGLRVGEPGPLGSERFRAEVGTWLAVLPASERLADDPIGLVNEVRAMDAPFEILVGGYPADLADYRAGVVERLPLVAALILVVTFVVLFLMTGSVIAPLKASALNLVSLSVMFGVVVWGFQEGGLAPLLGFTPTGVTEPSILLLMFCIAYGLSMDYEVFLLARIKEDFDRTGDVIGSVPRGIARSAPLVSAAALILAVSFAIYATSEIAFLQQLGIAMALAIAVDATIIRGVMVPALMRLAGHANWWAPRPLRRLHERIGLSESLSVSATEPMGAKSDTRVAVHR